MVGRFWQRNAKRSVGSGSDNARGCSGLSAVSLKKPHDIVILSFCYAVKGQAIFLVFLFSQFFKLAFGACQTKKIS